MINGQRGRACTWKIVFVRSQQHLKNRGFLLVPQNMEPIQVVKTYEKSVKKISICLVAKDLFY